MRIHVYEGQVEEHLYSIAKFSSNLTRSYIFYVWQEIRTRMRKAANLREYSELVSTCREFERRYDVVFYDIPDGTA
jgi:hypothetical protein